MELRVPVSGGHITAVDHGGAGRPPVLLVHGSGHNAAAWNAVAPQLTADLHVVAVDLRGHGRSTAESATPEQYWRDLAVVVTALGWSRPVLAGHSTGGYAVTAVTAAGLLTPAAVINVDGLTLDDRDTAAQHLAAVDPADLVDTYGYGIRGDAEFVRDWIDTFVRAAPDDPLYAGADPTLVRAVAARSFAADGDGFVRRPTPAAIMATTEPARYAPIFPAADVYDLITCPMTIVLPDRGFYADRRVEIEKIVAAAPDRDLVDIEAGHNAVMTHPDEIAAIIRSVAGR